MSNEQENPLVSVVIPTYKRPDMLGRAIDSVLNQTYDNIEIIVVDDNDEDSEYRKETEDFMEKYTDVNNLVYFKHKENKGGSAARNTGIRNSKGDFVAFLDDDDEWVKEKLVKQIKEFNNLDGEYGVVYHPYLKCSENKEQIIPDIKNTKEYSGNITKLLLKGNFIGTPVVLVKKEVFNKVGLFDENLPRLQDWELFIRISQYYKFKLINQSLTIVYVLEDSISSNNLALIEAEEIILKKHYELFKSSGSNILAKLYYRLGHHYHLYFDIYNGRLYLKKAIKTSFEIKYLLVYLLSHFGCFFYNYIQKIWLKIKQS